MSRRKKPPVGKGLYLRGRDLYAAGREQAVAAIAPRWLAVLDHATSDAEIRRYLARGLQVWLWEGPSAWGDAPEQTRRALSERVQRLGLRGYIADLEDDDGNRRTRPWAGRTAELARLLERMAADGARMSVGLSSFPAHPVWRMAARHKGKLWANPQLYGVAHPSSPEERRSNLRWIESLMGPAVVAIAGWGRGGDEEEAYLAEWKSRRAVVFWTTSVGPDRTRALAGFQLGPPILAAGAALAALAAVILVLGFRGLS